MNPQAPLLMATFAQLPLRDSNLAVVPIGSTAILGRLVLGPDLITTSGTRVCMTLEGAVFGIAAAVRTRAAVRAALLDPGMTRVLPRARTCFSLMPLARAMALGVVWFLAARDHRVSPRLIL